MLLPTDENGHPLDNSDFPDTRYEYSDGSVVYVGQHTELEADTSDANWLITKYDYTDGDVVRSRKRKGSWDDRASDWA